jgi:hypothetical protein
VTALLLFHNDRQVRLPLSRLHYSHPLTWNALELHSRHELPPSVTNP